MLRVLVFGRETEWLQHTARCCQLGVLRVLLCSLVLDTCLVLLAALVLLVALGHMSGAGEQLVAEVGACMQ